MRLLPQKLPLSLRLPLAILVPVVALPLGHLAAGEPSAHDGRGEGMTVAGAAGMAPGLSGALGAVHARARRCGLDAEAEAAAAAQGRHARQVRARLPEAPRPDALDQAYAEAVAGAGGRACGPSERSEITRGLADLIAAMDAFHEELAAVE
jgi:hypothetical protein